MHQGVAWGLLAILMQNHRPIAFHSQLFKGQALQLSTYEKELLALVTIVHKWRPYLLGRPFIIKTDHKTWNIFWSKEYYSSSAEMVE